MSEFMVFVTGLKNRWDANFQIAKDVMYFILSILGVSVHLEEFLFLYIIKKHKYNFLRVILKDKTCQGFGLNRER